MATKKSRPASHVPRARIEPSVVYTGTVQHGAVIRAKDILELRSAANELRAAAGLAAFTFTDASLTNVKIRAIHITELRTATSEARTALGLAPETYTDPTIVAHSTTIKAAHISDLRRAVVLPGSSVLLDPTRVQNLFAAGISPTGVFLKWSPSASPVIPGQATRTISGYRVYRNGALLATVTDALRYEDTNLTPNTTYTYTVIAVDSSARVSPSAIATATTFPTMPVGAPGTHPVLFPAGQLTSLAAGGSDWTTLKSYCDSNLNSLIDPDYAGWGWHDSAINYSTCYQVSKLRGETANATEYAKKAIALGKVLARHHNYGTPTASDQPLGLTNGVTATFTLPFAPVNANNVTVRLVATREIQLIRSSDGSDDLGTFAPIMKVASTAGGAATWASSNYEMRYRDGYDVWRIAWTGASKPATGSTYYVTVADGADSIVSSGYTINSGALTLTFNVAPAANQTVMVSYLGNNYEQTGNWLGGVNGVQPDGPGYPMRTFNPGLARVYDALLDSPLLTPTLKSEFYGVLNKQIDWCTNYCFENDGTGGQVGNYFIRGLLGGTLNTAYATDTDNPQASALKSQSNILLAQMCEGIAKYLPGGYGPQGQYANGTTSDIVEFLSLYKSLTGLDLTPRLDWTGNVVPATIHATKPDIATFYDGGDWDDLPATPIIDGMQGFLTYQPNHTTAPYARKLVTESGQTPASSGTVTDYRPVYPLSYFGQGCPFYARSDWTSSAVWMSLTSNDTESVAHQHRDAGHFTIQRGADYLLKDAGGYGYTETLYHNTLLIDDRNIPGYTAVSVYPPQQGWWGSESQLTKHADAGSYAYAQADFGPSYLNNDEVSNSVTRALRSIVFLRPATFVVFDQIQTAHAQILKTFNANFGGTLTNQGSGVWATTVGSSKLFVQTLLNSVTPVVTPLAGANSMTSSNYQETISGNTKSLFLHVFQATDTSTGAMTTGKVMKSVDRNVQGVEVVAAAKTWALLFGAYDRAFAGNVQYHLPSAGAHSHLVHDLLPVSAYVVSVSNAAGQISRSMQATSDQNGVLSFDSNNGESYFYVTPGTSVPASAPAIGVDPNL